MQHLQIRLRKYVTVVKSKAKMEQLTKFKENHILGSIRNITTNPTSNSSFVNTINAKNYGQQHHYSHSQQPRLNSASKISGYSRDNHFNKSPTYDNFRNQSASSLSKKTPMGAKEVRPAAISSDVPNHYHYETGSSGH